MQRVSSVDLLSFVKREDGVDFYKYKVTLSDGSKLEGEDFITAHRNPSKVKDSLIGIINDYYA